MLCFLFDMATKKNTRASRKEAHSSLKASAARRTKRRRRERIRAFLKFMMSKLKTHAAGATVGAVPVRMVSTDSSLTGGDRSHNTGCYQASSRPMQQVPSPARHLFRRDPRIPSRRVLRRPRAYGSAVPSAAVDRADSWPVFSDCDLRVPCNRDAQSPARIES